MIKPDGKKIQEIKDHFNGVAEGEIAQLKADKGDEVEEGDINSIRQKYRYHAFQYVSYILGMSPKRLYTTEWGVNYNGGGWREGYTKPTIKSRTQKRRAKKAFAKKTRQAQRSK